MTQTVSFRGVEIGECGSDFVLSAPGITGLGIPDVKSASEASRLDTHGTVSGPDYLGNRTLGIPINIFRRGDPEEAMREFRRLRTAWRPGLVDEILSVTIPGCGPSDNTLRYWGRPRAGMDVDMATHHLGNLNAFATFVALDPIGYGPTQTISLSGGSSNVLVSGDAPTARATVTITSDGGTPRIENLTTGGRVQFQGAVPPGWTFIIDLLHQTVRTNLGVDAYASTVQPSSPWFKLRGGLNTINVQGVGSASLSVRGGWW